MADNIARTKAKLGNAGYNLLDTKELCIITLKKATRHLKAAIREELESKNLHTKHQQDLISKHEATGNTKMAKKIRGMQHAEQVKQVFDAVKQPGT